jgi:hypothetical protein
MLKHFLNTFNSKTTYLPMQLPKTLHMEKTLRSLEKVSQAKETKNISQSDINQIIHKWTQNQSLTVRDKRALLFAGMDKFQSESNLRPLWNALREEVKLTKRAGLLKSALVAFYQSYGSEHANALATILQSKINHFPTKLALELQAKSIFGNDAPDTVSKIILQSDFASGELKNIKLSGLLFSSNFMLQVFQSVANEMSRFGYQSEKLKRFKSIFFYENERYQEVFLLNSNENLYAKSLLGYWDSQAPSKDIKEYLKHLFLNNLRDPRAYPQRWKTVDEQYQKIIKRWLTEESFEMLIQVLDAVADLGHWNDRKDFWSYYLKNEYISDSWVIFGTEAYMQAKKLQGEGSLSKSAGFAKFKRGTGSVQSNHSVIIMKIGNLVISEWTHSGRVRLFIDDSLKAPQFYKTEYSANHIRYDGYRISSQYASYGNEVFMDHHFNWQLKIAEFIRKQTGISHECLKKGYY